MATEAADPKVSFEMAQRAAEGNARASSGTGGTGSTPSVCPADMRAVVKAVTCPFRATCPACLDPAPEVTRLTDSPVQ
jgi:hypothetical protein